MDMDINLKDLKDMVTIPPPLEQPKDAVLLLSLVHLICFTLTLCGNVSQIVMQIYTRKIKEGSNIQLFLALFFLFNAFLSLGSPWLIVQTIIGYWTFGIEACHSFQATALVGRTMIPYTIVALYIITNISIKPPTRFQINQCVYCITFLLFFIGLIIFIIAPSIANAKPRVHPQRRLLPGDTVPIIFRTHFCVSPYTDRLYTKFIAFFVEFFVPLLICILCAIRLKLSPDQLVTTMSIDSINWNLGFITIAHFTTNIWFYVPQDFKIRLLYFVSEPLKPSDIFTVLPYVSSSVTWIAAANFSAFWPRFEARGDSPDSANKHKISTRSVRQLVPTLTDFHGVDYQTLPIAPQSNINDINPLSV